MSGGFVSEGVGEQVIKDGELRGKREPGKELGILTVCEDESILIVVMAVKIYHK